MTISVAKQRLNECQRENENTIIQIYFWLIYVRSIHLKYIQRLFTQIIICMK